MLSATIIGAYAVGVLCGVLLCAAWHAADVEELRRARRDLRLLRARYRRAVMSTERLLVGQNGEAHHA